MTKTSLILSFMLVAVGSVAACFNTKDIQSGGLKCAPSADARSPGVCPDGFFCGKGHLCYRNGTEGVALCDSLGACPNGSFCGEGHLCYRNGTEGVALCKLGERPPFGPLLCSSSDPNPSANICDPVCQSGCSCDHRCQLTGDLDGGYSFACLTPPGTPQLEAYQVCDETRDLCKPGLACLPPPSDSKGCVSRCYRYCRANADCPPDSQCIFKIDLVGDNRQVLICSPPAVPCDPVGPVSACNSSSTGDACYVFSDSSPDLTMCDCAGTIKAGDACQVVHSCMPGLECVKGICRKMCPLDASGGGCPSSQTCVAYSNSTKYGTCQ